MDDIRKGQIALILIKYQLREREIKLTPDLLKEVENEAKTVGIPIEEAAEFVEIIFRELVEEMFARGSWSARFKKPTKKELQSG